MRPAFKGADHVADGLGKKGADHFLEQAVFKFKINQKINVAAAIWIIGKLPVVMKIFQRAFDVIDFYPVLCKGDMGGKTFTKHFKADNQVGIKAVIRAVIDPDPLTPWQKICIGTNISNHIVHLTGRIWKIPCFREFGHYSSFKGLSLAIAAISIGASILRPALSARAAFS